MSATTTQPNGAAEAPLRNRIAKNMARMYGHGDKELSSVVFHAVLNGIESYEFETREDGTE